MLRVVATFLLGGAIVVAGTACEPDQRADAPQTKAQEKPQEKPKPKQGEPTPKPAEDKLPDPGVPKLTGDRDQDKRAVQSALVSLKTEWDNNSKLLAELLKSKNPDAQRVQQLKERNTAFQQRAAKLQEMLDKLRQ